MAESIEVPKPKRFRDTFKGFLIGLALGGSASVILALLLVSKFHAR